MRYRKQGQFQASGYTGLVEDVREMALHGLFADGELFGDVLVAAAFHDAGDDFELPRRQAVGLPLGTAAASFIRALSAVTRLATRSPPIQ